MHVVIVKRILLGSLLYWMSNISNLTNRDYRFINLALKMAEDVEPWAGVRMSSVLAYRGEILSFGYNDNKTHPLQARFGKNRHAVFWHAETRCIANAIKRDHTELLSKSTMYIVRITMGGRPALSRPCSGCAKAIQDYGIKRVVYSNGDPSGTEIPIMEEFVTN